MRKIIKIIGLGLVSVGIASCAPSSTPSVDKENADMHGKPVVYQVFTRLFGNTNQSNVPWGTIEQNGVGKFSDFSDKALQGIHELGVTHIWYTGVPHHDVIRDYTAYGISLDDPDVVKGRAGSPYAVKDYYNVNPDLADNPANRLAEFDALIERTHQHNMKVIIDIVPNHVARNYQSISKPDGVEDFGVNDDTSVAYARDNNFYYVPGEVFSVPDSQNGYAPLGGEAHPLSDGQFTEIPAKWTGNGSRAAKPDFNDWYETVKVNYGVRPDGSHDFPSLPDKYRQLDHAAHAAFWADKDVPNSWLKFKQIALYWLERGVDGFRYDMAEMVPVEFWSYLNSSIKQVNPDAFIMAEVYNPAQYRNYLLLGKMDYLYDKVEFYDSLKRVMQQKDGTDALELIQHNLADIEQHMLHFLENHDEQRIASPEFAGKAEIGKPAMVISTLISRSPTMLYFGQEVGEDGSENAGFGSPSRTSIFDYVGVPAHQRWMNNGKFDGAKLTPEESKLRSFYAKLLTISKNHPAMQGQYSSLHSVNRWRERGYDQYQLSFMRTAPNSSLIVVSNFHQTKAVSYDLFIPNELMTKLQQGQITDLLTGNSNKLHVLDDGGHIAVTLAPLESVVYEITHE